MQETNHPTPFEDQDNELMYIEQVEVVNDRARAQINEDFSWTKALSVTEIDGKKIVTGEAGELLSFKERMTETQFVSYWLDQFTIGFIGKKSYFNANEWGELTDKHQYGVLIVDDESGEPLFAVPPLSKPPFTAQELKVLEQAHVYFANAASATNHGDDARAKEIVTSTVEALKTLISEDKAKLSDYIPKWFFDKYNIIPYVKQSLIYCRDVYGLNPNFREDWEFAEKIFTDIHNGNKITQQQVQFIDILTNGEFKFPDESLIVDSSVIEGSVESEEEDDPFSS